MKKSVIVAFVLFVAVGAHAQSTTAWGVKAGLNVSNISNLDLKNKVSLHFGGFAEFRLSDYLSVQPELLYSRQGARAKGEGEGEDVKIQYRMSYLNIPVLAKLYVLDALSVDLGPEFAFALHAKTRVKNGDTTTKEKNKDVNTAAVNFALGLSYTLDNLVFSARYNLGLSNVMAKDKCDGNNKNRVFQLSIGYRFGQLF